MAQKDQQKRMSTEERNEAIYREIREKICLLDYPPGSALREETLAEQFEVSRTPIRRVLKQLEFEELVAHTPGAGVIVTTIDLKSLRDVYKLRLKIAEFVGEMMSTRIGDSDFEQLESLLSSCKDMRDNYDPKQLARYYNAFDEVMCGLIINHSLKKIQDQLFHKTARVWLAILPELNWEEEVSMVCEEISDVIDALRSTDLQQVSAIRRNHMSMLVQRLNEY